jgi:hypothetical protein
MPDLTKSQPFFRLPNLKAGVCSGLTLSGASLSHLERQGLVPPKGSTAKTPRLSPTGTPSALLLRSHRAILRRLDRAVCSFPQHAVP